VQSTIKRRLAWLALPLSLSLLAAACGDDDDDDTSTEEDGGGEEATEEDFSGESISISGSSTVEPISAIVAEEFDAATGSNTTVDGPGTGDGFELFCDGQTDISDASRAIEEEEIAACEQNGIEYIELQIGFDGMAVLTNPNNEDVECLSFADLYALIGPESEGFTNWSDAAPLAAELGSETEFPDAELALTGPGPESGTYDSFIEIALSGIAEERGLPEDQIETTRSDYDQSADDPVIIQNIEASDTSLGWVGWAFASEAGDGVRTIAVSEEPNGECVEVSDDTIADDSYPLSRPLYIYVNAANADSNPALAPFVDFYLADLSTWVSEALYVPLPEDQAQTTLEAWEGR
jgi:phosphate transport system substrate-binding protein